MSSLVPEPIDGVADRAAVDAGIRADLDIVADDDGAERVDARPALCVDAVARPKGLADRLDAGFLGRDEGEPVAADHRAGLADEPVADA